MQRDGARKAVTNPATLPDVGVFSLNPVNPKPAGPGRPEPVSAPMPTPHNHNTIFGSLVAMEADIAGFVAYGLYKQNKRDWMIAFAREHRRPPNEAEVRSYILGESTERRLSTYRHLAQEALAANGAPTRGSRPAALAGAPAAPTAPGASDDRTRRRRFGFVGARTDARPRLPIWSLATYILFIALVFLGVVWVLRSGLPPFGIGRG